MRKALIAGLVGLVLGGTAQAGELKIAPKVEKYTEKYYDGGEVGKIDGWLKGVEISNESDSFLGLPIASGLKIELLKGEIDLDKYDEGITKDDDHLLFDMDLYVGPRFDLGEEVKVRVIPAVEFVANYQDRDFDGGTEYKTAWYGLGGGLRVKVQKGKFWSELHPYYVKALKKKFHIENEKYGVDDTDDLGDTYRWGVELTAGYDLTERISLWGEFSYRYTHIDQNEVEVGGKPYRDEEKKEYEKGFALGVAFRW